MTWKTDTRPPMQDGWYIVMESDDGMSWRNVHRVKGGRWPATTKVTAYWDVCHATADAAEDGFDDPPVYPEAETT